MRPRLDQHDAVGMFQRQPDIVQREDLWFRVG